MLSNHTELVGNTHTQLRHRYITPLHICDSHHRPDKFNGAPQAYPSQNKQKNHAFWSFLGIIFTKIILVRLFLNRFERGFRLAFHQRAANNFSAKLHAVLCTIHGVIYENRSIFGENRDFLSGSFNKTW